MRLNEKIGTGQKISKMNTEWKNFENGHWTKKFWKLRLIVQISKIETERKT